MSGYVKGDPFWITAKRIDTCMTCQRWVHPGEAAFFWPKGSVGRKTQCESCGKLGEARFFSEVAGEVFS